MIWKLSDETDGVDTGWKGSYIPVTRFSPALGFPMKESRKMSRTAAADRVSPAAHR
jgi:hypothetical protein